MPTLVEMTSEIIQNPLFYNLSYTCFQLESSMHPNKGKMDSKMLI